jgi:hypothetical protein
MKNKTVLALIIRLSLLCLAACVLVLITWMKSGSLPNALAAPAGQIPIYTPTPGSDGRIIYVVKQGDTLIGISIISGLTVDQIRELNDMTDDNIFEGQKILLGLAGPAEVTITPGPTPTPTPLLPTPSPKPGSGNLCILLFNDANGDSIRQEEEPSIPDGALSVNNRSGSVNLTQKTLAGTEPFCFQEIPEGEYTVSVAVPSGYNPTTETSYLLTLTAGNETFLDFGAQTRVQPEVEVAAGDVSGQKKSPLLAIFGLVFLLLGVGLAIFARKFLKTN